MDQPRNQLDQLLVSDVVHSFVLFTKQKLAKQVQIASASFVDTVGETDNRKETEEKDWCSHLKVEKYSLRICVLPLYLDSFESETQISVNSEKRPGEVGDG